MVKYTHMQGTAVAWAQAHRCVNYSGSNVNYVVLMQRRTGKRLIIIAATVGIVLVIAVVGAVVLGNTAEESLQPVQGTKDRLPQTVRLHAEDVTHMRATLVRCGGITATQRECFVTFTNGRKGVALVTLTPSSVAIDSFRMGSPGGG